jgi:hypothetical protein
LVAVGAAPVAPTASLPLSRQLLLAVWMALTAEVTLTLGAAPAPLVVLAQLTDPVPA